MKIIKSILTLCMILISVTVFAGCKNNTNNDNESAKAFVGIAIFQNQEINKNWKKIKNNPIAINNYVSTKDNKLVLSDNANFLFYAYSQDKITSETNLNNLITNTKVANAKISSNTLSVEMERIAEETDILTYYIYKLEDNTFYLEYATKTDNITNASQKINLNLKTEDFNNIKLTVKTNLTTLKKY